MWLIRLDMNGRVQECFEITRGMLVWAGLAHMALASRLVTWFPDHSSLVPRAPLHLTILKVAIQYHMSNPLAALVLLDVHLEHLFEANQASVYSHYSD